MPRRTQDTSQHTQANERGTAFIEFIICVPFLIVIGLGVTSLGQSLVSYLTLYRIAYEGCRYAAATAQLDRAVVQSDADAVGKPTHQQIRQRIALLLQMNGLGDELANGKITITSARYKPTDITPPPPPGKCYRQDQVNVTLLFSLDSYFFFDPTHLLFGHGATLRAAVSGPYLYQDSTVAPQCS